MKVRLPGGKKINVEVKSMEEIAAMGGPLIAVPYSQDCDLNFITGTKNGFPCSLCGRDCILAPSGMIQMQPKAS